MGFTTADWTPSLSKAAQASDATDETAANTSCIPPHQNKAYLELFASIAPIKQEIILAKTFSNELSVWHNVNYYTITSSYGKPGLDKQLVNSYLMTDGTRFTDITALRHHHFLR